MKEQNTTSNASEASKRTTSKGIKISDDVQIKVRSNFFGTLFYENKRTGDTVKWSEPGEDQIMTMHDLRAMKAEQMDFFRNQWIVIMGVADGCDCRATCEDICKALVVEQHYKNYIEPSDYRSVCSWSEREIKERIPMLTVGAKENLIVALNGFIKDGTLDSLRKIKEFEEVLGCNLYEQ